jgi:hypothetical protein
MLSETVERGGDRKSESSSHAVTLKNLGIGRMDSSRWQSIASIPGGQFEKHAASAFPLIHHFRAAFGWTHALNITFDCGTKGVVRSNSWQRAADLAQRWELESLDHLQTRGGPDSGNETHRTAGY